MAKGLPRSRGRATFDSLSTDEEVTNRRWIDGKLIYRKVLDAGELPDTANKQLTHSIANLGTVVNLYGMAVSASGTRRTMPYVTATASDAITLEANATVVAVITYADWSDHTGHVIIEYTKA